MGPESSPVPQHSRCTRAVGVRLNLYSIYERKDPTMQHVKWLATMFVSPVAALVFSVAICGVLIVSLTIELHQQLWPSK